MKTWPVLAALLVLGAVPTRAQQSSDSSERSATIRGEMDLLELEREVDKQLLREAMIKVGQVRMSKQQDEAEVAALEAFIQSKKSAVVERVVALKRKEAELSNATMPTARPGMTPPNKPVKPTGTRSEGGEKRELIEELDEAQLEVQILHMQVDLCQNPLNEAMQALAAAEFAASNDESQREKANAARKRYDKAKEKFLVFSKKFQLEQNKVGELQQRMNFGGMGGGMR